MTKHERQARLAAAMILHAIARQYLGYPALEDSWWYLPIVRRWEPWYPAPDTPPRNRTERRLVGSLIVPSFVRFTLPHGKWVGHESWAQFSHHLHIRTGSRWDVDHSKEHLGYVEAERLAHSVKLELGNGVTHRQLMPAETQPPRERLHVTIWRGLLGGWDRELPGSVPDALPAPRYPAEQGTGLLEMPTVRPGIPGPPGPRQPSSDAREIEGGQDGES
jgi:hypothetical protein